MSHPHRTAALCGRSREHATTKWRVTSGFPSQKHVALSGGRRYGQNERHGTPHRIS
jgi:hypothetical protein